MYVWSSHIAEYIMYDLHGAREYQFRTLHRSCRRRIELNGIVQGEILEFSRIMLAPVYHTVALKDFVSCGSHTT